MRNCPTLCWADGKGGQKTEDTGPMTKKRMETADTEFIDAAISFIEKAHKADKPFFTWITATRMHVWTHLTKEWEGKSGIGLYADGSVCNATEKLEMMRCDSPVTRPRGHSCFWWQRRP